MMPVFGNLLQNSRGRGGRCRTHLPGGRSTAAEKKKKATTTVQCCTQSKATPTEPCNATARSQTSAAFHAQRLQRSASADTAHAFLLVHLSCQQRKHSFVLVPSAKRPPSPLMIQCINTFSHQRGADVLRYRILGRDCERCFKKH